MSAVATVTTDARLERSRIEALRAVSEVNVATSTVWDASPGVKIGILEDLASNIDKLTEAYLGMLDHLLVEASFGCEADLNSDSVLQSLRDTLDDEAHSAIRGRIDALIEERRNSQPSPAAVIDLTGARFSEGF